MTGETSPKVWLIRAGKNGEDEATVLEQGIAMIGYQDIPDLSGAATSEEILELVRTATQGDRESRIQNWSAQVAAFALRAVEGDIVALPRKTARQIALGRIKGPYEYREVDGVMRHVRNVEWLRPDAPRSEFQQGLLYSLGAFMTVCRIQRNDAQVRIAAILGGQADPGATPSPDAPASDQGGLEAVEEAAVPNIAQMAHDQVLARIESRFAGHDMARLVDAVLVAEGYMTRLSPPGPDGGVDILAGQGPLGLDHPRLCVQVKSSSTPADVTILRALQGTMGTFSADHGLLVCWGGFTRPVLQEARQAFFSVRLWDASELVGAIYRVYDRLPEEIQADLPLKRVWTLVLEGEEV